MVALAIVVVAHLIVVTVRRRQNGHSQAAVLSWFSAVRLYGLMLAVNMAANAVTGRQNAWAFYLFGMATLWLLYSLARFLRLIRGRLL